MKKKVGRIEAILIMKAAKEFRDKQNLPEKVEAVNCVRKPEKVEAVNCVPKTEPVVPKKKSFFTWLINLFKKGI